MIHFVELKQNKIERYALKELLDKLGYKFIGEQCVCDTWQYIAFEDGTKKIEEADIANWENIDKTTSIRQYIDKI